MIHAVPSAEEQLAFIRKLRRLLDEGQFVATYKYALLHAIADLCVVRGDDTGAPLTLATRELAERFVQCVCDLLEGIGLPPQVPAPADAPADLAGRLARNAALSTPVPLRLNPRPIDEGELKAVFQELLGQH